ncbi:GntR family transcriptional regulator [Bacillus sp. Marseille-P3661]|uniref:GntR family transcriptional regulator n=1 Tax=Bacillus sp. Marseille-P3661 TaxID=1936234 RepID=UPI000C81BF1F|nr:GntR family transcriptional regulator [Bacillus sp. Marseille-P3661]
MHLNHTTQQWETLGEKISYVLRLRIVSGVSVPGTKISENQIAREFETSRSPVRDALKVLSNEGLIRLERMGAVVLGLQPKDLIELYEVRSLIESFALKRHAENYDESFILKLENIIEKLLIALKYKNHEEVSQLDYLFHETIILSIDHNRIKHLWDSIKFVVYAVVLITTEKRLKLELDDTHVLIESHQRIIDALKTMDPIQIEKIIHYHFSDAYNSIRNLLM